MTIHVPNHLRLRTGPMGSSDEVGNNGYFILPMEMALILHCICGSGAGWEHVSVSTNMQRCPTWEEMCFVKGVFWDPEDAVMQLHPPASTYINEHPHTLHLWRPNRSWTGTIPLPPPFMVGPTAAQKADPALWSAAIAEIFAMEDRAKREL